MDGDDYCGVHGRNRQRVAQDTLRALLVPGWRARLDAMVGCRAPTIARDDHGWLRYGPSRHAVAENDAADAPGGDYATIDGPATAIPPAGPVDAPVPDPGASLRERAAKLRNRRLR